MNITNRLTSGPLDASGRATGLRYIPREFANLLQEII